MRVLVTEVAGALLPHRFTLTATHKEPSGRLLSVALSRGLPLVAVNDHPTLWSPDFPPTRKLAIARPT